MRSLQECQAEVFRRSEKRIRIRRRAIRAVMVCVPLVLCLTVFGLLVRPGLPSSPDEAPPKNNAASPPPAACRIDVSGAGQVTSITDEGRVRAIADTLSALNGAPGAEPSGGSESAGAEGRTITLFTEDGPQAVYRLTDDTLTNITTGSAMALTREQSAALSALLAPEAADNP